MAQQGFEPTTQQVNCRENSNAYFVTGMYSIAKLLNIEFIPNTFMIQCWNDIQFTYDVHTITLLYYYSTRH